MYTFSVVMQSRHPAFAELGPYAVGYVDLDEGFRMMTNIVGVKDPTKDIHCGMRVKLRWEDQGDGDIRRCQCLNQHSLPRLRRRL